MERYARFSREWTCFLRMTPAANNHVLHTNSHGCVATPNGTDVVGGYWN